MCEVSDLLLAKRYVQECVFIPISLNNEKMQAFFSGDVAAELKDRFAQQMLMEAKYLHLSVKEYSTTDVFKSICKSWKLKAKLLYKDGRCVDGKQKDCGRY